MSLEELLRTIDPPAVPTEAGDLGSWARVEREMGTALPKDYKDYINRFGAGSISGFVWPLNPFSANKNINFQKQTRAILDAYEFNRASTPQYYLFEAFPAEGGLLPWAITDNGDQLFWETVGKPDNWSVVLIESRGAQAERYRLTATEFLSKWLRGQLDSKILPKGMSSNFQPGGG